MSSFNIKKKLKNTKERYNEHMNKSQHVIDDTVFNVDNNIKAEYDMWVWIYQEIANLRLEVSRLGTFVRINNKSSPEFLETYHSHIYSLLIPVSTVLPNHIWKMVDTRWLQLKKEIIKFNQIRKSVHNKKIPFELIRGLDSLYRIALLSAQKAGLGIRITFEEDIDAAIESQITGT